MMPARQSTEPFALHLNFADVLREAGVQMTDPKGYGPAGLLVDIEYKERKGAIIVTQSPLEDGPGEPAVEYLHASISFHGVMPEYTDLQLLHRAVYGRRRWAYQVFAPEASHVSGKGMGVWGHEFALHLWGRADGRPVLPDFGSVFGTV
jgi:hypothetical protein